MPDSLLLFLKFIPAGLLIGATCVEGFILHRQDRDSEPAVLWLLCCSAVAAAFSAVLGIILYFVRIDPSGLHWALGSGILAAVSSVAWVLKRLARNRSFLLLRERFFDTSNANLPPAQKPWQAFLLIGYRFALILAVLCGIAFFTALSQKPAILAVASAADVITSSITVRGNAVVDSGAREAGAPPLPTVATSASPVPTTEHLLQDPTRSEIPSAEASAVAAMAVSAASPAMADAPIVVADTSSPQLSPQPEAVPVVTSVPFPASRPVSMNSVYFSKVRPIFAKACVSCHGPLKQKGDLRLDSPDEIRAGVNGKAVVVPGVPEKSRVYHVTGLPAEDTDKMPPKGTPLNSAERAILADWIRNGADLGDGVSIPAGQGGIFIVDTIAASLSPPDAQVMEDLKKDHVVVRPLSRNGYILELDFSHSDRAHGDLKLSQLGPIALNIHALDFSRTNITDVDLGHLLPMKNLSRLLLSRTTITDAGLPALKNNTNLEHLNLYNTGVTDAGIASLAQLKSLKKVYLWQSKATPEGARQLQEQVPGLVVSIGQ